MMKKNKQAKRLFHLCKTLQQITANLDLNVVLRETLSSACMLTGARNGVLTTVDESGKPQEFISVGLDPGRSCY